MSRNEPLDPQESKKKIAAIFDRAAGIYDQVGPRFFSHFGRRLVQLAHIPAGALVLDVATGRGALLYPAAEAVGPQGRVTGVDLSPQMVRETTQELARLNIHPNVEVRQMDAERLQFPDGSFDFVLCGFAIFFFPELDQALAEFRRVLKPGGRICVSTWARDDLAGQNNWLDEIIKNYLPPEPETAQQALPGPQFHSPQGLTAILNGAGFEQVQIFHESADFVYTTELEFWSSLWSRGVREVLETIEQSAGKQGLENFRSDVLKQAASIRQSDGLHHMRRALIGLAARPAH